MVVGSTNRSSAIRPQVALSIGGLAAMLGSLDTAVNIGFPDLTSDLDLGVDAVQWIVVSYVLTYTCLLVGAGRIVDLVGHRTMLVWGLAISSASFLATAATPSFILLLGARALQGVGVAIVLVAAPAMITVSVPPQTRGRGLGLFQMSAAVGLALGPLVGGGLVEVFGWRSVFWFRFPLAVVLLWAVLWFVPSKPTTSRKAARLDSAPFRHAGFWIANGLNTVANGSMFGIWVLVPYYTTKVLNIGPVVGGVLLMVVPASTACMAPIAGWVSDRCGGAQLVVVGLLIESAGLLTLGTVGAGSSLGHVSVGLAAVGVGLGLFGVPNMNYVMGLLSAKDQGLAAGASQMARTVGVVIGVFTATALFNRQEQVYVRLLGVEVGSAASFVPAFQDMFIVASIVCFAGAIVSVVASVWRVSPSLIRSRM